MSELLRRVRYAMVLFSLIIAPVMNVDAATLDAASHVDAEWGTFRKSFPYHVQLVGLTRPETDGSRILIFAEPPPHLGLPQFHAWADALGGEVGVKTNPIGYDGWVKDVVVILPRHTEAELLPHLAELQRAAFGTTYKARVIELPFAVRRPLQGPNSLQVTAAEIHHWLFDDGQSFEPVEGGPPTSVRGLLAERRTGVFLSAQPGLVLWAIARRDDLTHSAIEARQFFVDSDLLVGAVATDQTLLVLGRERQEPLAVMPPLRVECALVLAAAKGGELAQSYERNQFFAGKLKDKQDWAPIYLSNILVDTEFGSLLNITDQLLKSWSLDGTVRYVNFDYPGPGHWPPFPVSILSLLEEGGSFLFNWNTAGVGWATQIGPVEVMALHATGSLPVTYDAGQKVNVKEHERIAYAYFSALRNPDLARVVQYTALYQIFHRYGIATTKVTVSRRGDAATKILFDQARKVLTHLHGMSPKQLEEIAARYAEQVVREEQLKLNRHPEEAPELAALLASAPLVAQRLIAEKTIPTLHEVQGTIELGEETWPGEAISALARVIAAPRDAVPDASAWDLVQSVQDGDLKIEGLSRARLSQLRDAWSYVTYYNVFFNPRVREILRSTYDIGAVKSAYVDGLLDQSPVWIRTPSIVLSRDMAPGGEEGTGGHNLDATVTTLRAAVEVPKGEVRVLEENGEHVILYNPGDVERTADLSRVGAVEAKNPKLSEVLTDTLKATSARVRQPEAALDLTKAAQARAARGLDVTQAGATVPRANGWGWRPGSVAGDERQRIQTADTLGLPAIIVERVETGYRILQSNSHRAIEVPNVFDIGEALSAAMHGQGGNGRTVRVMMQGFEPQEAQALLQSAELQEAKRFSNRSAILKTIDEPGGSVNGMVARLRERYDWSNATIRWDEAGARLVTAGPRKGFEEHRVIVEVPAKKTGKPSLFLRILIYMRGKVPDGFRSTIDSLITRSMKSDLSTEATLHEAVMRIRADLKEHFGDDVDIDIYGDEKNNVLIADRLNDTDSVS